MIGCGMADQRQIEQIYLDTIRGARRGVGAALARGVMSVGEVPYAGVVRARNALFDAGIKKVVDLRRPTVSVGNLTAGGTGKTPVVRWLAERFLAQKLVPAVLTRGYAKSGASAASSDEAYLLERAIGPVGIVQVGRDRAGSAGVVLNEHPNVAVFILDDAFQHRRAKRDVDLVLVNAAEPFGYGHVHPRGLLREPISGISRATAVLLTHATRGLATIDDTIATIRRFNRDAPIFRCDHVLSGLRSVHVPLSDPPDVPMSMLLTQKFYATAGIGHPASLRASLEAYPGRFVGHAWWDDHHHFTDDELTALIRVAESRGATAIVTTEKDWSKIMLDEVVLKSRVPFYRLDLGLAFHGDDEQRLYDLIRSRLQSAL